MSESAALCVPAAPASQAPLIELMTLVVGEDTLDTVDPGLKDDPPDPLPPGVRVAVAHPLPFNGVGVKGADIVPPFKLVALPVDDEEGVFK